MAKSFKQLRDQLPTERRKKVEARTREWLDSLPLFELRQARRLSQEELAARLNVRQAAVSRVERRTDLYLSTLRRHIEAMGGTLVIQAEFPDGCYRIETIERIGEPAEGEG